MTSIETSISLIEAERRDLYGQMKALDDALFALRQIRTDVAVSEVEGGTPGKPLQRRTYSVDEKRAAVARGQEIGWLAAGTELAIAASQLRRWAKEFEALEDPPAPEPVAREIPAAMLAPLFPRPRPPRDVLYESQTEGDGKACSCGATFDDDDGWKAHNETLRPSEFRDHKLLVPA